MEKKSRIPDVVWVVLTAATVAFAYVLAMVASGTWTR